MTEYNDCTRFSIIINKDDLNYVYNTNNSNFNQQVKPTAILNKPIISKKINYDNISNYQNNITLNNIQYSYWYY